MKYLIFSFLLFAPLFGDEVEQPTEEVISFEQEASEENEPVEEVVLADEVVEEESFEEEVIEEEIVEESCVEEPEMPIVIDPLPSNWREENLFVCPRHSLETLNLLFASIESAEQSIDLSLCFTGGWVLEKICDAVAARLEEKPHMEAYILASPVILSERDKASFKRLQEKHKDRFHLQFSTHVPIMFPEYTSSDNHIKCWIIDEKYFCLGGTNYDEVYCTDGVTPPDCIIVDNTVRTALPRGSRDYDIVGRGPLAKELREIFHKHFAMWEYYQNNDDEFVKDPERFHDKSHYRPVPEGVYLAEVPMFEFAENQVVVPNVKIIVGGVHQSSNKITDEYVHLIEGAQKEIVIGNLYSNPALPIYEGLKGAINRGVALTIITNGNYPNSPSLNQLFNWGTRINYVPFYHGREYNFFERAAAAKDPIRKTEIYEYCVPNVLYHKKVMVIDGRYTLIGSYNLGKRSHQFDFETVIVLDSEDIARNTLEVISEDKKYSVKISPELAREWYFNPAIAYMAALQKQFHGFF